VERARRGASRAAALVVVVVVAASCSAPGSWRVIRPLTRGSTPAPIDVDALACGSPTNCVALPVFSRGPMPEPPGFGEAWDGASWTPISAPARNLYGLSCAGEWCMAIARPSAAPGEPTRAWTRTAGGSWTEVADLSDLIVSSVDCAGARHCVAVGQTASGGNAAVVRHWDGRAWTTVSDTRPTSTWISHVQCLTDGSCAFVTDGNGDGVPYVFERWDGAAWSRLAHVGTLPKAIELSCGSTLATCAFAGVWAGDGGAERSALLHWTGARWEPDPFEPGEFVDEVECLPDGACVAKTQSRTLTRDGSTWRSTGVEPPQGQHLACGSASVCFIERYDDAPVPTGPPPIVRWDGTSWQPAPVAPNPVISDAALVGVSCPTATWCLAVGEYREGLATRPLAERWNGSTWSHVADLPVPADVTVDLKAVSCTAVDRCVAVGSKTRPGEQPSSFAARWTGTAWTDESAASFAANPFPLNDVSCVGTTCVAVGNASSSVVAIRSDAAGAWANMPPPPGAPVIYDERNAVQVACAATTSCAATSVQFLGGGIGTNLSYWNGTSWSVPADTGGLSPAFFADVACPAPGSCIAVAGSLGDNSGASATWTGSKWVTQPMPIRYGLVSCDRTDRCLAGAGMGPVAPGGAGQLSDAQLWNGSIWRPVRRGAPTVPAETVLSDLSCTSGVCVAVGSSATDPLAYRFRF
jgi:hypothetical protein